MAKFEIRNCIIPGLPQVPFADGKGAYKGVVAHATATAEASDEKEVSYFQNNWKKQGAFVQFFVDWDSISQTASMDYRAWGAGAKANPYYVHVELCETADQAKFEASYARYVWLLAWVLFQRKLKVLPKLTFFTHSWITQLMGGTTHRDPDAYLASHGVSLDKLVADVTREYNELENPGQSAPIQTAPAPEPAPPAPAASAPTKPEEPSIFLKIGSRGDQVAEAQRKLGIPADGIFGSQTDGAVRSFQRAHGLDDDGIIGKMTWAALQSAPAYQAPTPSKPAPAPSSYPGEYIRFNSRGENVKRVQRVVGVTADGIFGRMTEAAVKNYQRAHGLSADGIVGKMTWDSMF